MESIKPTVTVKTLLKLQCYCTMVQCKKCGDFNGTCTIIDDSCQGICSMWSNYRVFYRFFQQKIDCGLDKSQHHEILILLLILT